MTNKKIVHVYIQYKLGQKGIFTWVKILLSCGFKLPYTVAGKMSSGRNLGRVSELSRAEATRERGKES